MSTSEIETTMTLILCLKKKMSYPLMMEIVLDFWIDELSKVISLYLRLNHNLHEATQAAVRCRIMVNDAAAAIQSEINIRRPVSKRLLMAFMCSAEEANWQDEYADKYFRVEYLPVAEKMERIKLFIIEKVAKGLSCPERAIMKVENAMESVRRQLRVQAESI
jgi:hypothetical protein